MWISPSKPRSHLISLIAAASEYSSASQDDCDTTFCFLLAQLTGSPFTMVTQPVIDLRSVWSLPQSASAYALTEMSFASLLRPKSRPVDLVPARYRSTRSHALA